MDVLDRIETPFIVSARLPFRVLHGDGHFGDGFRVWVFQRPRCSTELPTVIYSTALHADSDLCLAPLNAPPDHN